MRIDRLQLLRYGCFTDVALDLSAPGLHVVVGPNEAGKSTARAAVSDLLFGFPVRTPQAHIHASSDLCLGAAISTRRGEIIVERHKRKPHLRDPAGDAVHEDILAGASMRRDLYEALFAMGHEELREGAAELLRTRGDIGRILFGVTAGRAGAAALLDRLQAEADDLFKPRVQKRGVMAALALHSEARDRLDAATLPPATWSLAAEELDRVETAIAARQNERLLRSRELRSLESLRAALPLLARRALVIARRDQLDPARIHREARERVTAALNRVEEARTEEHVARQELERISSSAPEAAGADVLALESEITALQEDLGAFRQALVDLPRAEARAQEAGAAVAAAAARCGVPVPADAAAAGPPVAAQAEALLLAAEFEEVRRAFAEASTARHAAEADHQAIAARAAAPKPQAVEPLAEAAAEVKAALADLDHLEKRAAAASATYEEIERRRDDLAGRTSLPTTAELRAARDGRDQRWRAIRAAWADGRPYDSASADALDLHLAAADAVADRRHLDAEATGHLSALDQAIEQSARESEAAQQALAEAKERVRAAVETLRDALDTTGRAAPAGTDASALVTFAEAVLADAAADAAAHAQIAAKIEAAEVTLQAAVAAEKIAEKALHEVTRRWTTACAALGLDAHLSPGAVRAHLEALRDLAQSRAEESAAQSELHSIGSRITGFETGVAALARHLDPAPAGNAEACALELIRRLRTAVEDRAISAAVRDRVEELGQVASAAAATLAAEETTLRQVAEAFQIDVAELEAAVEASARRDEIDAEMADVERLIVESSGGEGIEAMESRASAHRTSGVDIESQITELGAAIADIDRELDSLHVRRGELRNTLAQWRGADDASRAGAEMQEAATAVTEAATRYARLRIAHEILRREVDRNREQHQGPVLRRAASHLATLTANRYTDILDAIDDGAVLDVRRYDGEVVGVERLSEGTRDQLWLALRLAALERWCDDREPLPLVLDDVCMTFDDERTAAALQLLAQISEHLQVLFFTHHESVAAAAARVIPAGRVKVHRLERFSPPVKQAVRPRSAQSPRKKRSPAA